MRETKVPQEGVFFLVSVASILTYVIETGFLIAYSSGEKTFGLGMGFAILGFLLLWQMRLIGWPQDLGTGIYQVAMLITAFIAFASAYGSFFLNFPGLIWFDSRAVAPIAIVVINTAAFATWLKLPTKGPPPSPIYF